MTGRNGRCLPVAVFLLVSVMILTSCGGEALDKEAAAREQIARLIDRIEDRYAAGDSEGLADLYAADAVLFNPNNPPVVGHAAIAEHKRAMLSGTVWDVSMETEDLRIEGDLGVEHGRYTITLAFEGTPDPITDRGNYILVWKRVGDDWRIQYDMSMSAIPRR